MTTQNYGHDRAEWYHQYSRNAFGSVSESDGTTLHSDVLNISRTSVNFPQFHNYRLLGRLLPMQPYSYSKIVKHGWSGIHRQWYADVPLWENSAFRYSISGAIGTSTFSLWRDPLSDPFTALQRVGVGNNAATKVRNLIKDQTINLAQVYAERELTDKLIADTAIRLAKAGRSLRHFDFVGACGHLGCYVRKKNLRRFKKSIRGLPKDGNQSQRKALANGWLELQYGWKPLLQDVYGGAEFLARRLHPPEFATVKGKDSLHDVFYRSYDDTSYGFPVPQYANGQAVFSVKYTIRYSLTNPGLKSLSELGITNPLALAWELMPFSFVVDWFLPIGSWISSFDATLGCTFLEGCKTTFIKRELTQRALAPRVIDGSYAHYWDTEYSGSYISCTREILTDFPVSGFPTFRNPLSATHVANAIALLQQVFFRK